VRDYFVQGRRGWVRLHEKGGKEHEVPCHHNLETYLDEYIAAAGIAHDPDGPLFRTAAGKTGELTRNPMWQQDAYRMIQRRAADAGIKTKIGNHTFPCDRHHRVPEKQRHARTCAVSRQPREPAHDQAL
jgi:integrase/recombinase XerD